MARYEITSPEGKRFEINAPDGATQEQVLQYAQTQFASPAPAQPAAPAETDTLKEAAPYYLGPAGTLRAGRDLLKTVDDITTRVGYGTGGFATDLATKMGASPETAATTGVVANMAGQGAVSAGLGQLIRAPALLEKGARTLMQSAVKPSLEARRSGRAADAITTMLERNIPATEAGRDMLKTRVADLEDNIQ